MSISDAAKIDHARQLTELRGRAAYEAYRIYANGVSLVDGTMLPTWDHIERPEIREAWRAAADAAVLVTDLRDRAVLQVPQPDVTYCADADCDGHGAEN